MSGLARFRLFLLLLASAAIAAVAASAFLGMTIALLAEGPLAIPNGLMLGMNAIGYGLTIATLPALLLGALLWLRRVRLRWVWAATGALAGLACYGAAFILPWTGEIASFFFSPNPVRSAFAFAIAGALAALNFRLMMVVCTAYDEALTTS